jgi:small subunit ribosomal protein S13
MGSKKPKVNEEKEQVKEDNAKEKKAIAKKKKMIEGIRGIVRIGEIDIEGEKKLRSALLKIKGVGKSLSKGFVIAAGLDPDAMIGSLNEEQIDKLEDVMKNPLNYGIPYHMLNRKFESQTGGHRHLISSELSLAVRADIDAMKKMRSYKGIRHELGLPVRGQRTRSSFRTGAGVGVVKKKLVPGAAPQAGAPSRGARAPAATVAPVQTAAPAKAATPTAVPAAKKEQK